MIDNRTVGKTIATLRQGRSLTQQQLAAALNVSHQAVSKWENGAALPDIQTMQDLCTLFGITLEQLLSGNIPEQPKNEPNDPFKSISDFVGNVVNDIGNIFKAPDSEEPSPAECTENEPVDSDEVEYKKPEAKKDFSLNDLLNTAPFMSKTAVAEMLENLQKKLSPEEIAKFAPFLEPAALERLIKKCEIPMSWDALRRIAPFLKKEVVDNIARMMTAGQNFGKNEIPKAMGQVQKDLEYVAGHIEKGINQTVKNVLRFGEDVGKAFNDLGKDNETAEARLDRLRVTAFERALTAGRWDWMEAHISELHDPDLLLKIAETASALGKKDWILKNLPSYADTDLVRTAIMNADWEWLADHAWKFDVDTQKRIALKAMHEKNWAWLTDNASNLDLHDCVLEIAREARIDGEKELAAQLIRENMDAEQIDAAVMEALDDNDTALFDAVKDTLVPEKIGRCCVHLACADNWEAALAYASQCDTIALEWMLELAIDNDNFDAIDALDALLRARIEE